MVKQTPLPLKRGSLHSFGDVTLARKPKAKTIHTLVPDMLQLLEDGIELSPAETAELGKRLGAAARQYLADRNEVDTTPRLSKIGMPNRRLWYDFRGEFVDEDKDPGPKRLRMAMGGMIEELVLFVVRKSGHSVTDEQKEVELEGIPGHIDCRIDGALVDIKSASPYSFSKFKTGKVLNPGEDPFGYVAQLSSYNEAMDLGDESAYWLVINKSLGDLALVELDPLEQIDARARAKEVKALWESARTDKRGPDRCYALEPMGKKGNLALSVNCSWCPRKHHCYAKANDGKGIRSFQYGHGVKELVKVVQEPRVAEVTDA